jgi:hypothetical protein
MRRRYSSPSLLMPSSLALPGGVLARNQSQPRCQISAFAKGNPIANRGHERGRNQPSETGDFHQTATGIILFCDASEFGVGFLDPLVQFVSFVLELQNQQA